MDTTGLLGIVLYLAYLARLPFKYDSFSCILNILSLANYSEFKRLLMDERINKVLRTNISDITINLTVTLAINKKK